MLITALLMTAALMGGQAPDDPGGEPDSVVATAPGTTVDLGATAAPLAPPLAGQTPDPHGLSTDQQIAQWLTARAPAAASHGEHPLVWHDDRERHGEVSVGFGTGGYRDYAASVSLPIGENGRLDLSVRQVKNGYPYGYGYGYGYERGYGDDPYFDDRGYLRPVRAEVGYGRRLSRPEGPMDRRPLIGPLPSAAE